MRHPAGSLRLFVAISAIGWCSAGAYAGSSFKVGSFAKRTSTGSQTVAHGLGTTPKAMMFWTEARTNTSFAANFHFGFGMTDGATSKAIGVASLDGVSPTDASRRIANSLITIVQWSEVTIAEASFTSWDATNLVINWTTSDANAYVIHYMAIGGTDVSAKVINWTGPLSTGNSSVTGVGFQPDLVIHAHGGAGLTASPPASSSSSSFGLGVMNSAGNQWANSMLSADNHIATVTARYQRTTRAITTVAVSPLGTNREASYVSMDSDGFTLNWPSVSAGATQFISLALKGLTASVGSFNKSTGAATATQAVTGTGFTPGLVMLSSVQNTSQAAPANQARYGLGASDGTTQGSSALHDGHNLSGSSVDDIDKTTKVFMKVDNDTPALDAEAGLTSMDSNGFTLSWTTNDAVLTEILYLAMAGTTVTLGNGTDPSNASLAPGGAATMADAFTFQTNGGTAAITDLTVTLATGTSGGLSLIEITNDAGSTVYGSVSNPSSDTPSITLSTNITASTTSTQYKVRLTPKSHANMPAPSGSTYSVTAYVSAWTGAGDQAGSDSGSATVTIDNQSPGNVTGAALVANSQQVTLSWQNPADSDLGSIVVLRRASSAVTDTPVEGSSYSVGNTIGSSTVACVAASSGTSCTDTGLTNGTAYHYKLFTKDTNGNYAAGATPAVSSATPQMLFFFRKREEGY